MAGGVLVLALVCALPAVSAAQDPGTSDPTTTTTPAGPADPSGTATTPAAPAEGAAPGAPTKVTGGSPDGSNDVGRASPGDAPSGGGPDSSSGPGGAHKSSTVTVRMEDFDFAPPSLTIHVGDLVTWRNTGNAPHTATADDGSFDTGTVASGQRASHMFTQPGTFSYYCAIHPNMHGTVRVLAAAGSGGGSSGSTASSSSSGQTEAQAVNSPDAAANSNHLAATGMAVGGLALAGLLMLASGFAVKLAGRRAAPAVAAPAIPALSPVGRSVAPSSVPPRRAPLLRRRSGTLVLLLALLLPVGLRLVGRQR